MGTSPLLMCNVVKPLSAVEGAHNFRTCGVPILSTYAVCYAGRCGCALFAIGNNLNDMMYAVDEDVQLIL